MDFNLNREHQLVRKMMANSPRDEVEAHRCRDRTRPASIPGRTSRSCSTWARWACASPKEYGGAGADLLASAICIEEPSKRCAPPATSWPPTTACAAIPSSAHGTEAQKADSCLLADYGATRSAPSSDRIRTPGSDAARATTGGLPDGDTTMSSTAPRSSSPTALADCSWSSP
ncbi:MAG: acyl-CoA dehydrogenase family protein [Oscillibacter sp.]